MTKSCLYNNQMKICKKIEELISQKNKFYESLTIKKFDEIMNWTYMTKQEKVIRLVKGGMQQQTGMSVEEFILIYKDLLINYPEKLI